MFKKLAASVVSLSFVASLFPIMPVVAAPHKDEHVKVLSVLSGDWLQVSINGDSKFVKVIGMDAPDRLTATTKAQCYSKDSWVRAKKIAESAFVTLIEDETQGNEDKNGNLLRNVVMEDGRVFGTMMIRDGYAKAVNAKKPSFYQKTFMKFEKEAKAAKRGFWAANKCDGFYTKTK
ncbi:MAG: thermonuclease family protein [bacterium]|nr:thermonuclease family protein [bacterium]